MSIRRHDEEMGAKRVKNDTWIEHMLTEQRGIEQRELRHEAEKKIEQEEMQRRFQTFALEEYESRKAQHGPSLSDNTFREREMAEFDRTGYDHYQDAFRRHSQSLRAPYDDVDDRFSGNLDELRALSALRKTQSEGLRKK